MQGFVGAGATYCDDVAINRRAFIRGGLAAGVLGGMGLSLKALSAKGNAQPVQTPSTSATIATARATNSPSPEMPSPSTTALASNSDISNSLTKTKNVALTFHGAGDAKLAQAILDEVKSAGIGITVMAVGTWVVEQPQWAKRIIAEGHDLGNHTMTHKAMMHLNSTQANSEISLCTKAIRAAVGQDPKWFRPSGTPISNSIIRTAANANGFNQCITYNVDSLDYTDPTTSVVVNSVLDVIKGGDIISLHLGHAVTTKALPAIIEGIAAKNLSMTTISGLLGI